MLFDLGWSEILLVGVVALVFIGPKDLPKALRVAGFWVRKARTLSREFQSSIDQMIRESELDEMRQDFKKASEFDLQQEFHNTIEPPANPGENLKPAEPPSLASPELLAAPAAAASVEATLVPQAAGKLAECPGSGPGSAEPAAGAATPGSGEAPAGFARDIAPPRP